MRDVTEQNVTDAVLETLEGSPNARAKKVLGALIRHLHAAVRESEPTSAEWLAAIAFLTQAGQKSDDQRQELILLSDTLGISTLVDAINNRKGQGGTESSLLGPFYVPGAPDRPMGADLSTGQPGTKVTYRGHVRGAKGAALSGASLEVWQTAANGLYDIQDPAQPPMNLRARFTTGEGGQYHFTTLLPVSYPVPTDGPVGVLLELAGRHPYRPAHTHFSITAPGHRRLVTELFLAADRYLDSDAVFGVKRSLVVAPNAQGAIAYDFVLESS